MFTSNSTSAKHQPESTRSTTNTIANNEAVYSQVPMSETSITTSTSRLLSGGSGSSSSLLARRRGGADHHHHSHSNRLSSKSRLLNELLTGNKATQAVGAATDFVHIAPLASAATIDHHHILKSSSGASSQNVDSVISSLEMKSSGVGIVTGNNNNNCGSGRSSSRDEAITCSTGTSQSQSQSSSQVNLASAAYTAMILRDDGSEYVYTRVQPQATHVAHVSTTLGRTVSQVEGKMNSSHSYSPLLNASNLSSNGTQAVRTSVFRPKEIEPKHETSV
jgi:hypothetical protein